MGEEEEEERERDTYSRVSPLGNSDWGAPSPGRNPKCVQDLTSGWFTCLGTGRPHRLTDEFKLSPCLGACVRACVRVWLAGSLSRVESGWRILV